MAAELSAQDSRKRTLEALERRFAVAKAELLTQQKKSKTSIKGDGKQHHTTGYTSTDSSLLVCGPSDTAPLSTSSKKVVPKKISVFVICVDGWKVTLYGDKLTSRKSGS